MSSKKSRLAQRAQALSASASWADACTAWQAVVQHDERDPQAWSNLALARAYTGQYPEAIDAFGSAMQHGLAADEVAAGMGLVFCLRQQYDVARENLEMAVASNPDNIRAWANLVVAYVRLGLVQHAFQAAERVLAVEPENASVFSSLGTLCKDMGMADEAIAWCQRAADAAPRDPYAISNLLWAMLHSDSVSAQDILTQAGEFEHRAHALAVPSPQGEGGPSGPGEGKWPPNKTTASIARPSPQSALPRIKLGWVSADLRNHAVGYFVVPILEKLDRTQLCSTVYYASHIHDEMSQRAQHAVDTWRDVTRMSDAQLAARIAQDDLDILIDLGGHTDGSRLQVFTRRLAPAQMTWLGYPDTSGLSTMDYVLVPPDSLLLEGSWCSETPLALRGGYCARDIVTLGAQDGAAPPFDANGFITFGCLNNFAKVSPSCIATWAAILGELPDSKLIMVATGGSDADLVGDMRERFAAYGINPDRLDMRGRMSLETYRSTYREIDIGLDPFPFNGGTTGFDSLCMGTPFVTLAGSSLHARMGANLLNAIGLNDLVATTLDEYAAIAITLANQRERVRALHAGMRQRMRESALMDTTRFACGLEELFRKIARPNSPTASD